MTQNKNIYNVYKPLRNNLRKLCLEDSLFVIWNYTQYLQFGKKISEMIEVDPALVRSKDTISWRPDLYPISWTHRKSAIIIT